MPKLAATHANLSDAFLDARITFHDAEAIMETDFSGLHFTNSRAVNRFYDRIEERIADSGQDKWFFLVNYSDSRIDPEAWIAYARRGRALNMAYSMGSVRFDAGEVTRAQIERSAGTENFDANLFSDRDSALARVSAFTNTRQQRAVPQPSHAPQDLRARVTFDQEAALMEVDFSGVTFANARDVNEVYDHLEQRIAEAGGKWFFLVNYENCQIEPAAWVRYASRGKRLNLAASLGTVRYAPGSETATDIRLRSESQEFEPNIRNTREEALARIAEMRAEAEV